MSAVERAAEVMHRSGRAKSHCGDGCPFPDCCYSDMEEEDQARALADAGLLVTDADRAVLEAARIVVRCRGACEHPVEPLLSLAIARLSNKLDARREAL